MSFGPGDQLRVRRPLGYDHHGIYIDDGRVIQFGGGIHGKFRATIEAVSLAEFEGRGRAEVVAHGGPTWFGAWRPDADPPETIIERAEWLLVTHPLGMYDLLGYNCEHAATFCATGWPESFQVRGYFAGRTIADAFIGSVVARHLREGTNPSRRQRVALVVWVVIGIVGVFYSWSVSKRFWEQVGLEWRRYVARGGS